MRASLRHYAFVGSTSAADPSLLAYYFDSTDINYFSGGTISAVQPVEYTVAAWVRPDTVAVNQGISVRSDASGPTVSISHTLHQIGSTRFEAHMYDGSANYVQGTTAPQAGVWFHVCMTAKNSDFLRLYVNGASEGVPNAITTMWAGGTRQYVASNEGAGATSKFKGWMTEFAIWTKQLTAPQVAALAVKTQGLPATIEAASLMMYCPMHDTADGVSKTTDWNERVGGITQTRTNAVVGARFATWQ